MSFIVSKKFAPEGMILVITDKEIVGKIFEEGNKQLDLSKKFYLGDERTATEIKGIITESYILHLTGEKAIALGIELNFVDSEKVIWISNIPHAEVLLIHKK
jgi:hypothetical protein